MERISKQLKKNTSEPILTTGFDCLDNIIHSFDKSNLYILAGRPGMGKTSLGLKIVHHLALSLRANVVIISYEMTISQIKSRLLSISSEIPNKKILNQELNEKEEKLIKSKQSELFSASIYADCPSALCLDELKNKVLELNNQSKIDFLFIDDIQRITISDSDRKYASNREQEVSKNVRDIKALAKEIKIPILAISQLNRDNKERENRKPILTDIRDSGAIENDSDVIIFLHRPEYYGITEDEHGNSLLGLAEVNVAKNRHGSLGEIHLGFKKEIPNYFKIEFNTFSDKVQTFGSTMNAEFDDENFGFDDNNIATNDIPF